MKNIFKSCREYVKNTVSRHSCGQKANIWLATVSFSEASFFLIPPDIFLIPVILKNRNKWVYYAGITTLFSILGGIFGYFIGFLFYDLIGSHLVEFYDLYDELGRVKVFFDDNSFLAIFTAAFTPIPFKVFTLSAGLLKINFIIFLIASVLGRGIRFFVFSYLLSRFGDKIKIYLHRYFNLGTVLIVIFIFSLFLLDLF